MTDPVYPKPRRSRSLASPANVAPLYKEPRTTRIFVRWDTMLTMLAALFIGLAIGSSVTYAILAPALVPR